MISRAPGIALALVKEHLVAPWLDASQHEDLHVFGCVRRAVPLNWK
jgi:hypothetical protein